LRSFPADEDFPTDTNEGRSAACFQQFVERCAADIVRGAECGYRVASRFKILIHDELLLSSPAILLKRKSAPIVDPYAKSYPKTLFLADAPPSTGGIKDRAHQPRHISAGRPDVHPLPGRAETFRSIGCDVVGKLYRRSLPFVKQYRQQWKISTRYRSGMRQNMKPAAIYCRSSKDKAELGIDIQERELAEFAASRGMQIVARFSDMEISGSLDETARPGPCVSSSLPSRTRGADGMHCLPSIRPVLPAIR
jgi:hypothetical protein